MTEERKEGKGRKMKEGDGRTECRKERKEGGKEYREH